MTEVTDKQFILNLLDDALRALRGNKPNDHTENDRRYAVTITELEKVIAYFGSYVDDK